MHSGPLLHSITSLPKASALHDAERGLHMFLHQAENSGDESILKWAQHFIGQEQGKNLLHAVFGNSPYLTRLLTHHLPFFRRICEDGMDAAWVDIEQSLRTPSHSFTQEAALMQHLRRTKTQAALLIALGDITGQWPLARIMQALSNLAEHSLTMVCDFLLHRAHQKNELSLPFPEEPSRDSGFIVLGMGKLGGQELNYSSDIDLIIFFDREKIRYTGNDNIQKCMSRMALDIVRLMQERTSDGYVFRTDLRLRPDPASTPPAISVGGAITYYETVGQNWERAALIKARPVAGDRESGREFLKSIAPFIWRKHLDFAAIADIHSIKRQMNSKVGDDIELPGHNIKLGVGGIREIEFFAQVHQLIWGGRFPALRTISTCDTLNQLVEERIIQPDIAQTLIPSYCFYRRVEHHLQMIADQQTHSLPESDEEMQKLSIFLGFEGVKAFEDTLQSHLITVHKIFSSSLKEGESLGAEGNLVFTGVENDPETLKTIAGMGYSNSATVSEIIRGWHHGSRRATRTKRARELITELTPALLKALAATSNPDNAFLKFDEFLTRLPAGVQLFSLFTNNPHLLGLIATIMGSAPAMAENLSKNPNLLDTVLTVNFYDPLPPPSRLLDELEHILVHAQDFEDAMNMLRRFKNEKHFQAGVQILTGRLAAGEVGPFLTDIAEITLHQSLAWVEKEFTKTYGTLAEGGFGIIGLGKLGARELTFGSDIDLVFVYDAQDDEAQSNGEKPLNVSVYYNRLAQRFISALTMLTREGRLYEVDTRLRPSGKDGPLAVSVEAFDQYFSNSAWTFEFMALTRGRFIGGNPTLQSAVNKVIHTHLTAERDKTRVTADAVDMRGRIAKEYGTTNPWNIKYIRGGMIDLDFIAQCLVLIHAHTHPDIIATASLPVFEYAGAHGLLPPNMAQELTESGKLLGALLSLLRLLSDGSLDEEKSPAGLHQILCTQLGEPDLAQLKSRLVKTEQVVYHHFAALLKAGT